MTVQQHSENEWIEHDGKEMPVAGDTFVEVRFRSGSEEYDAASGWYWLHDDDEASYDIIAYRVVSA